MKKVLFCVLIVVLLLVSCETTSTGSTGSTGSGLFNSSNHNNYSVRTYSSNYGDNKTPFSKGDVVLIGLISFEQSMERPFELELSSYLRQLGLKTYIWSDYGVFDRNGIFDSDKYGDLLSSIKPDFSITCTTEPDSIYTFTNGGGISQMLVSTDITNFEDFYSNIEITSTIEGNNNFEKYYSSIDTVVSYLTKSIGQEISRYISK